METRIKIEKGQVTFTTLTSVQKGKNKRVTNSSQSGISVATTNSSKWSYTGSQIWAIILYIES